MPGSDHGDAGGGSDLVPEGRRQIPVTLRVGVGVVGQQGSVQLLHGLTPPGQPILQPADGGGDALVLAAQPDVQHIQTGGFVFLQPEVLLGPDKPLQRLLQPGQILLAKLFQNGAGLGSPGRPQSPLYPAFFQQKGAEGCVLLKQGLINDVTTVYFMLANPLKERPRAPERPKLPPLIVKMPRRKGNSKQEPPKVASARPAQTSVTRARRQSVGPLASKKLGRPNLPLPATPCK